MLAMVITPGDRSQRLMGLTAYFDILAAKAALNIETKRGWFSLQNLSRISRMVAGQKRGG
jgi:hypothetical protein